MQDKNNKITMEVESRTGSSKPSNSNSVDDCEWSVSVIPSLQLLETIQGQYLRSVLYEINYNDRKSHT